MAGPILLREEAADLRIPARRITKDCENSKPVFRSFIASFDVASYNGAYSDGRLPEYDPSLFLIHAPFTYPPFLISIIYCIFTKRFYTLLKYTYCNRTDNS